MGKYLDKLNAEAKKENPDVGSLIKLGKTLPLPNLPTPEEQVQHYVLSKKAATNYLNWIKERPEAVDPEEELMFDYQMAQQRNLLRKWRELVDGVGSGTGLYDPNMTDAYLADHIGDLCEAINAFVEMGPQGIRAFLNNLNQYERLGDSEKPFLDSLNADFEKVRQFNDRIVGRFELMVSPAYRSLKSTNLTFDDRQAIRSAISGEQELRDLQEEVNAPAEEEKARSTQQLLNNFPQFHAITTAGKAISNDTDALIAALRPGEVLYIRNGNTEDWYRVIPEPEGNIRPEKLRPEESEDFTRRAAMVFHNDVSPLTESRENNREAYRNFMNSMPRTPIQVLDDETLEPTGVVLKNEEEVRAHLLFGNQITAYDKTGKLQKLDPTGERLQLHTMSAEEIRTAHETAGSRRYEEYYYDPRALVSGPDPYNVSLTQTLKKAAVSNDELNAHLDEAVNKLYTSLSKNTRFGRSSENYKNVQSALRDYRSQARNMDTLGRAQMLKNIASMAQQYIDGKAGVQNPNSYTRNRINAMQQVAYTAGDLSNFISIAREAGLPHERSAGAPVTKKQLDAQLRTTIRAMEGRPFDKDSFAYMAAAKKVRDSAPVPRAEFSAMVDQLKNTPAVLRMERYLNKQTAPVNKLEDLAKISADFEALTGRVDNMSPEELATAYRSFHRENNAPTGVPAFDEKLIADTDTLLKTRLAAHGYTFEASGKLQDPSVEEINLTTRRNLTSMLPAEKLQGIRDIEANSDRNITIGQDRLAQSMFGTDNASIDKTLGSLYGASFTSRGRCSYTLASYLHANGLSMKEIVDPNARLEDKRRIGTELMGKIDAIRNAASPSEASVASANLKDELFRNNMDSALDVNRFVQDYTYNLDTLDPNAMQDFYQKLYSIKDGMWDMINQVQNSSDMFGPEKREATLKIYGHENETPDATIDRVSKIFERLQVDNLVSANLNEASQLARLLEKVQSTDKTPRGNGEQTNSFEVGDIQVNLADYFKRTTYMREVQRNFPPENAPLSELSTFTFNATMAGAQLMPSVYKDQILPKLGIRNALTLALDPELKGRLNIKLNPEALKHLGIDEMTEDLIVNRELFGRFELTFEDGTTYALTPDFLNGHPTPADNAAFNRFRDEITVRSEQKEAEGKLVNDRDRNARLDRFAAPDSHHPEGLPSAVKNLFGSDARSFDELTGAIQLQEKHWAPRSAQGDPLSGIIVGDRSLDTLVNAVAGTLSADYAAGENRQILAAGIMAAAQSKGVAVHRGEKPNLGSVRVGYRTSRFEIPTPDSLKAPGAAQASALEKIWSAIPDKEKLLSAGVGKGSEHEKAQNELDAKLRSDTTQALYREKPELLQNFPVGKEKLDRMAETDMAFREALTGSPEKLAPYTFADGRTISGETAVLVMAYARSFEARSNEEKSSVLKGNETLKKDSLSDPVVANALSNAKTDLATILSGSVSPEVRDKAMRVAMVKATQFMNARGLGKDAPSGLNQTENIGTYAENNRVRLKAQGELLNFIATDNIPSGIGLKNEAGQTRSLSSLMGNENAVTAGDLQAIQYLRYTDSLNNVLEGKNLLRDLGNASDELSRLTALQATQSDGSKRLPLTGMVRAVRNAEQIGKDIRPNLPEISDPSRITSDFLPALRSLKNLPENSKTIIDQIKSNHPQQVSEKQNVKQSEMVVPQ